MNGSGAVGSYSSESSEVLVGAITEYADGAGAHPYGITSGPDGNLWATNEATGKIGKITPSGTITEYAGPSDAPRGITAGPDGNLWFVEHSIREVNRMTTAGALTTHLLTRTGTYNTSITTGPDGNLWFTESESEYVAKMTRKALSRANTKSPTTRQESP